ncbi:hypothetical protein Btru_057491 [Bulinus truncatus]|nr:hypothetical protein Btru_057491 [Bulinus truncatus]
MFSTEAGGRDSANDVVIVITDRESNFPNKTQQSASELKKTGVTIISVGVGTEPSLKELRGMAIDPNQVIMVNDFKSLAPIIGKLIHKVCQATSPVYLSSPMPSMTSAMGYGSLPSTLVFKSLTADGVIQFSFSTLEVTNYSTSVKITSPYITPRPVVPSTSTESSLVDQQCNSSDLFDIILVLDASSSINSKNWNALLTFVGEIVRLFRVGPYYTRFGAVIFNRNATKMFDLKTYNRLKPLVLAIHSIKYPYIVGTRTHEALKMIRTEKMFSPRAGGRDGAQDVVIVITDGMSNFPQKTQDAARGLKRSGVTIYSVGFGNRLNLTELQLMASSPDMVFIADKTRSLKLIKSKIIGCYSQSITPSVMPSKDIETDLTKETTPDNGADDDVISTVTDDADGQNTTSSATPSSTSAAYQSNFTMLTRQSAQTSEAREIIPTTETFLDLCVVDVLSTIDLTNDTIDLSDTNDISDVSIHTLVPRPNARSDVIDIAPFLQSEIMDTTLVKRNDMSSTSRFYSLPDTTATSYSTHSEIASNRPYMQSYATSAKPPMTDYPTNTPTATPATPSSSSPSPTSATSPACDGTKQFEIILTLDASKSVGAAGWTSMTRFAGDLAYWFKKEYPLFKFGALTVRRSPILEFDLKTYIRAEDLQLALLNIQYQNADDDSKTAFVSSLGFSSGSERVFIFISGGKSDSPDLIAFAAREIAKLGIKVISIGVGNNYIDSHLEEVLRTNQQGSNLVMKCYSRDL